MITWPQLSVLLRVRLNPQVFVYLLYRWVAQNNTRESFLNWEIARVRCRRTQSHVGGCLSQLGYQDFRSRLETLLRLSFVGWVHWVHQKASGLAELFLLPINRVSGRSQENWPNHELLMEWMNHALSPPWHFPDMEIDMWPLRNSLTSLSSFVAAWDRNPYLPSPSLVLLLLEKIAFLWSSLLSWSLYISQAISFTTTTTTAHWICQPTEKKWEWQQNMVGFKPRQETAGTAHSTCWTTIFRNTYAHGA